MTTPCTKCSTAPTGAEGHSDLFTEAMTGNLVRFKCRACGTLWSRRYMEGGGHEWSAPEPGAYSGVQVPRPVEQS